MLLQAMCVPVIIMIGQSHGIKVTLAQESLGEVLGDAGRDIHDRARGTEDLHGYSCPHR
jgi:hypothetical protein